MRISKIPYQRPFFITVLSDISNFSPVSVPQETNEALNIQVIPQSDTISLELDDRINLRFTPNTAVTTDAYFAETGEFLRDFTALCIMDDDSECCAKQKAGFCLCIYVLLVTKAHICLINPCIHQTMFSLTCKRIAISIRQTKACINI